MILIKATLEFASAEDRLILLDEPDAHIHLENNILFPKAIALENSMN